MQASRPIIIIVYKYVNAATYVKDILRYEWDVACKAGMGTGSNALPDCMGVGSSGVGSSGIGSSDVQRGARRWSGFVNHLTRSAPYQCLAHIFSEMIDLRAQKS